MVQSIFDTQDEQKTDDPWLSEFSAIDPSIAPERPEPVVPSEVQLAPDQPEPAPIFEALPPPAPPETHFDPYADEPFDGFGTVVREPWLPEPPPVETPFAPLPYEPETVDETVRRSGLAWSLGIMFFASVAFMMFLGWGADLLLGTSPWGLVGGIILGSLIGFVQFFRTSSRLFNQSDNPHEVKTFLSDPDGDD